MPDASINQLARGFLGFLLARTAGEFIFTWNGTELPSSNYTITFPVRIFTWLIVMDLAFYCYHRTCHEVPWLWSIHQKHHATKHPSPTLSILADGYQEIIEIALVPLFASLVIPMSFHEIYLTMCYT